MLICLYYLYKKLPKNVHELEDVVKELSSCLSSIEMPHNGKNRSIRACGTWFVAHKVAVLARAVDRFSAYISHVIPLTEDPNVKSIDKKQLKGYIEKWCDFKILGCAFFNDVLKTMCHFMQNIARG